MAGPAPNTPFSSPESENLPPPEVAVVVARYHGEITDRLLEGALGAYRARYGTIESVRVVRVPGAFEIPHMVSLLLSRERYYGYVTLGCIVKGETSHDEVLGNAVTNALATLSLEAPVGLGVLTVNTVEQARERAGGSQGNKGADAMEAVISLISATDEMMLAEEAESGMNFKVAHAPSARSQHKSRKKESR